MYALIDERQFVNPGATAGPGMEMGGAHIYADYRETDEPLYTVCRITDVSIKKSMFYD